MNTALEHSTPTNTAARPWWRDCVTYQTYLRSFADGDGDGIGDIRGIRSRLGYLADLGVDAVWITPWYRSPMLDGGYDVADYRDIDPRFGTLDEAVQLFTEAHRHDIRVLIDIVPNHTSWEHPWFREALAAGPGSAARERYIFRPGRGPGGAEPPSDWQAVFGGPAWERTDDGEWYFHLFDPSQPDLNWEHAEVRAEFDSILRFWLDLGADGVRVDVAHGMVKDFSFGDFAGRPQRFDSGASRVGHPFWDRDGVHEITRGFRRVIDAYDDRMMVAEARVPPDRLPLYLRPDEYHQSFNFDLLDAPWSAHRFAEVIGQSCRAAAAVGALPTWVLSNHDIMRHATRYGLPSGTDWRKWLAVGPYDLLDAALGARRARAAALVTLSLPGSVYVYQGDELGLPEYWDLPVECIDDPTWERSGHTERGRDGCRIPMPWSGVGPSLGFSPGDAAPWLPQPAGYAELAADSQAGDPDSMLELYRTAITLRRELLAGCDEIEMLRAPAEVVAYERGTGIVCAVNMGADAAPMPDGELLLSSGPVDGRLPGDTAVWLRRD